MTSNHKVIFDTKKTNFLTFFAITIFYFFETMQMTYFNVLAPGFLSQNIYQHSQIGSLSASYYYGDMLGLLPVGFMLDYFSLRKILLSAILGSIIGAFILIFSQNFYLQWVARFISGFFGGTFSFVGGIRIIAILFSNRFSLFMSLFLSAGMFGGLVCQYPFLIAVTYLGIQGAMSIMAIFGLIVIGINFLYLHPPSQKKPLIKKDKFSKKFWTPLCSIFKNYRNWCDCFMIILLDTPVSIIGTLWGIVILINYYHFSATSSAWIVMSLFAGLMIGLPIWGVIADRHNYPAWVIIIGASVSFFLVLYMLLMPHSTVIVIAILFFSLGFFSSCQTLGFTWLTKNMDPELIGRNSALNSMLFMGSNGGLKQIGAYLLSAASLFKHSPSVGNLLILISLSMLLSVIYACNRKNIFKV